MIVRLIDYLFDKIGIKIIPKWKLENYFQVIQLKQIFEKYKVDCVMDVGANTGQYAEFLRKQVKYNGLIFSFEPDPKNLMHLNEKSTLDNMWNILDYALGENNETMKLNIMEMSTFNSFLSPNYNKTDQFSEKNKIINQIDVPVRRLDEVILDLKKNYRFQNIFLKLDTQGFDLQVFKGVIGCINLICGIQSEVSFIPIYQNMPTFEDSLKLFKSFGYQVSGLYPLSSSESLHAIEFDCIYLSMQR